MAQHAEPMDIDDEGVFDNKENTYQHSNVLPKTPSTEKGYEELDVSELNMKLSSSSSTAQTPEATTPTKDIPKHDGGSPIMRGLKSVLSMFRSSQSPIPPEEGDPKALQPISPADVPLPESKPTAVASTPKIDIPLPNDDDINDNFDENVCNDLQDIDALIASTSQNVLMAALNKSIVEAAPDVQHKQYEPQNNDIPCQTNLLPSDVPLTYKDEEDSVKSNIPHKAITAVIDPASSPVIDEPDTSITNVINDIVNIPIIDSAADIPGEETKTGNLKTDDASLPSVSPGVTPLAIIDDSTPNAKQHLEQQLENSTMKSETSTECAVVKSVDIDSVESEIIAVAIVNTMPDSAKPEEEHMEISFVEVPPYPNEKEVRDSKDNILLPHKPEGSNTTINLDSTHRAESTVGCEEKIDEEIILSESNSPFVSMSAEEEFGPGSKKDDFEEIENPFPTDSKVARSPPISPKIVSKGYNFNFDDIDNINPFATKTKIKMSPPPGASPNDSLNTDKLNKTEIIEPVKSEKNINRRKSMPERKKPLKAKRHLNSSVDSTEKASPKATPFKNDELKNPATIKIDQKQSELSQPELNQYDISTITHVKEEVNNEILSSEITTHEDNVSKEPPSLDHPKDVTSIASVISEVKTNLTQNNEAKVVEEVVKTSSDKSPANSDTSSSEQSTYLSTAASSTELTESKNVFNLPELDGSNPFATKSKIRQSPPKDFDMDNPFATKSKIKSSPETSLIVTKNVSNDTVTIDYEEDLKEVNCSVSSKTSDEKDVTVHEVHTEDEDTLEGPFLEADEGNEGNIPELPEDKVDVVDFDNMHQPDNDDAAEMFIDAEAFEFLMNQNKTDEVAYSGKESLFLKFDPLFARRVTSEGVAATLNDIKRKQITPKKAPRKVPPKEVELLSFEKPVASSSDLNGTYDAQSVIEERSDEMNVTVSKPMLAVTPAVNPVVTPRKSLTPNRSNRLSMTFTSPAMAVIDRLLSLSGNSPSAGLDATVTHVGRAHSETDQALTQLRELLAEKEIHVYNLRCETKELKDRLSTLETQMKSLEAEGAERLKKVNELNENLAEKTKMNRNMAAVVEEYERTIASLISETEQDKKRYAEERNQLIRDRDEQTAHLASMEVSFNDLHSKYEKSKQVILGYKTNEEAYKKSIEEFEGNLAKMHTNYEMLKQHATSKLNHANQELEKINKAHESEILKFNAMLKRKEVHITSLEESLAQKTKANEELTAICDELINKVG
ncbi:transforming acidic coiled-coil-containing protein 3-like [Leguminivora glycinivorella]|uniref:transforming acidic coiled-coil-containing protein 3-like n=1 Tax=Leguminivora glycinivorella TaxID=1035111 RepID=UPI00201022A5|nr:transforming acidic coiled-coil-containing protein 3-like [Leguminivora glycinivorella]